MNEEQIAEELKLIRHYSWDRPDRFKGLKLLEHPAVVALAQDSKEVPQLVMALRKCLEQAKKKREKFEKDQKTPRSRSVAFAAGAVLGLDDSFNGEQLQEIRPKLLSIWKGARGNSVSLDTFRLHSEPNEILSPFAADLHGLFVERENEGKPRPEETRTSPRSRQRSRETVIVQRLKKMEEKTFKARVKGIERDGELRIRNETEMLDVLLIVNGQARKSLRAVDQTPIAAWDANEALKAYLNEQLARVEKKKVTLERIYIVDEKTLQDETNREHLVDFVERHDAASATLLLCPVAVAKAVGPNFFQKDRGLLLADMETRPVAITGKLGKGKVGTALIYTRGQPVVQEISEKYKELQERVREDHHDQRLRKKLKL